MFFVFNILFYHEIIYFDLCENRLTWTWETILWTGHDYIPSMRNNTLNRSWLYTFHEKQYFEQVMFIYLPWETILWTGHDFPFFFFCRRYNEFYVLDRKLRRFHGKSWFYQIWLVGYVKTDNLIGWSYKIIC